MLFLRILCISVAFIRSGLSDPYGYGSDEYAAAKQAALDRHNMYRSWHGMPPMTMNEELSDSAEEWASILASGQQTGHSPKEWRNRTGEPLGENLYHYWSTEPGLHPDIMEHFLAAVDGWYYELCDGVKYPRFDSNGDWNLNHNTQVLWRDSVEVGMGFATQASGGKTMVEVAAHYLPTGNWVSEGGDNLGPPICHTEQQICSAYAAEEPLEGYCGGNALVPIHKPEPGQGSQEREGTRQHISTPDEPPVEDEASAEETLAPQEQGSMQMFGNPFMMNGGLFDSMLGSMNDRMKGYKQPETTGGDINAYREGEDSDQHEKGEETSDPNAGNDESKENHGDAADESNGGSKPASEEESGTQGGTPNYGMQNGMMPNGMASNGMVPNGMALNGMAPNGMAPNGMVPNGMVPNGTMPNGMAPNGMMPNGVAPYGMMPNGMVPNGMAPNGMMPNGIMPNGMPLNGMMPYGSNNPVGGAGYSPSSGPKPASSEEESSTSKYDSPNGIIPFPNINPAAGPVYGPVGGSKPASSEEESTTPSGMSNYPMSSGMAPFGGMMPFGSMQRNE
ncbi:Golgi-associated plant pathogenesis-related protein 1 [Folsomia candida]|uniref:Golgi-associated plant pathogenesis-related protein 1 n=1 Tax=Folsomia candida TaxID=158441 RepID=A0A226DTU7_FOLCA|nr:Golgi-associated plant pathogenesis-related protein 1 [Folsomia candida]